MFIWHWMFAATIFTISMFVINKAPALPDFLRPWTRISFFIWLGILGVLVVYVIKGGF